MLQFLRHQNADGAGASDGGGDATGGQGPGASAQGADGSGATGGSDGQDDIQAKYNALVEEHKKQGETLGKLSNETGELRKFRKTILSQPKEFIASLAKERGLNIRFEEANANGGALSEAFNRSIGGTGDQAAVDEVVKGLTGAVLSNVQQQIAPTLTVLREQTFAAKYNDWDGLAENREEVKTAIMARQLDEQEVLHYAVRGMRMSETLNEVKKQAYAQGREDLIKEYKAARSAPGAREDGQPGNKPSSLEYTEKTVLPWLDARTKTVKPS